MFDCRDTNPEGLDEDWALPFGNTPQTEGCSWNPVTRENGLVSMETPLVKNRSLHNAGRIASYPNLKTRPTTRLQGASRMGHDSLPR